MTKPDMSYGTFYKAVDKDGLSFYSPEGRLEDRFAARVYPVTKAQKRDSSHVDWVDAIGHSLVVYELPDQLPYNPNLVHCRLCGPYLLHGYANLEMAHLFGESSRGRDYQIVEFRGQPVDHDWPVNWERRPERVKYGFRVVDEVLGVV